MKDKNLTSLINDLQEQASTEENVPELAKNSMNVLEEFVDKVESLEDENQKLQNELNKLKGETVPPNLRKQTSKKNNDHSSTKQLNNYHPKAFYSRLVSN